MATHSRILALENPVDRGAWWAAVRGVAESDTTERLSSSSSSSPPEVPFPLGQLGQSDSGLGRPAPRPSTQPENIKGFPRCQHVDQLQGLTKSRT